MAPVRNAQVILKEHPKDFPIPGQTTIYSTSATIDLENVPLEKGSVLVKTLCLSIDPSMRGYMNPNKRYQIGKPLTNFGIVKVLRSSNEKLTPGDILEGFNIEFAEYSIQTNPLPSGSFPTRIISGSSQSPDNFPDIPKSLYTGILGMPGKTAYYGWKEYAQPKKGETLFVTTGAGPVGSMVIQLARLLDPELGIGSSLKIIASAGSEEKVEWMKTLGVDVAFNYKTKSAKEVLKEEGPIDIFWDHVGGEALDAAIEYSRPHARIIKCGTISGYNGTPVPVNTLSQITYKMTTIYGHFVGNPFLVEKWQDSFDREVPKLVSEGKIKYIEDKRYGLDQAEQAIVDQQKGKNDGKLVVIVSED